MKFQVDAKFWNKANFLAKACLVIGVWFIELGMKLNGLEKK